MLVFLKRHAAKLATAVLLLQASVYYLLARTEIVPPTPPWSNFATQINEWKAGEDVLLDRRTLDMLQPDDYLVRSYKSAESGRLLSLFVGYFKTQRKGFAPHSPEACLPGAGWKSVSSEVIRIPVAGGGSFPVNQYRIAKGESEQVVIYWYQQGVRSFTSQVVAQFYTMPELLMHGRTDIGIIRIVTPVRDKDLAGARDTAIGFARDIYPKILEYTR